MNVLDAIQGLDENSIERRRLCSGVLRTIVWKPADTTNNTAIKLVGYLVDTDEQIQGDVAFALANFATAAPTVLKTVGEALELLLASPRSCTVRAGIALTLLRMGWQEGKREIIVALQNALQEHVQGVSVQEVADAFTKMVPAYGKGLVQEITEGESQPEFRDVIVGSVISLLVSLVDTDERTQASLCSAIRTIIRDTIYSLANTPIPGELNGCRDLIIPADGNRPRVLNRLLRRLQAPKNGWTLARDFFLMEWMLTGSDLSIKSIAGPKEKIDIINYVELDRTPSRNLECEMDEQERLERLEEVFADLPSDLEGLVRALEPLSHSFIARVAATFQPVLNQHLESQDPQTPEEKRLIVESVANDLRRLQLSIYREDIPCNLMVSISKSHRAGRFILTPVGSTKPQIARTYLGDLLPLSLGESPERRESISEWREREKARRASPRSPKK